MDGIEQVIVPAEPAGGVVQDHPGLARDTNRCGGVRTSVIVTTGASLGPEFVTTMVYRNPLPGRAIAGVRDFVTPSWEETAV